MENNQTPTKQLTSNEVSRVGINITSEIQKANVGKQIRDCSDEEIKQVLRYIFVLLGTKAELIPDGLAKEVIMNFIKDRLWLLTIDELKLSFVYAVEKRTEVELTLFGETFSAKTILEVVDCFNKYKRGVLSKVKKEVIEPPKKTQEEIDEILKDGVLKIFDDFRKGATILDGGNVSYNYLVRMGLINLSKERKRDLMALAKGGMVDFAMETKHPKDTIKNAIDKILPESIQSEAKKLALLDYFKNLVEMDTELKDLLN